LTCCSRTVPVVAWRDPHQRMVVFIIYFIYDPNLPHAGDNGIVINPSLFICTWCSSCCQCIILCYSWCITFNNYSFTEEIKTQLCDLDWWLLLIVILLFLTSVSRWGHLSKWLILNHAWHVGSCQRKNTCCWSTSLQVLALA
jgi:hypothetical protein